MAQQQKLHRRDHQQPLTTGGITGTPAEGIGSHYQNYSEKRKHRVLECDSDEDDFAGFDEDAATSENGVLNSPRSIHSISTLVNSKKVRNIETGVTPASAGGSGKKTDEMESLVSLGAATGGGGGIFETSGKGAAMIMAAGQTKRKVIAPVTTQDDAFRLPFKYGWKRELVYRAHLDGNSKDKGEVYYITPAGKKLRTRNDIVMALHDGLTMDNFTFMKDPVGGSPDEEIIRSAKSYGAAPRRSIGSASAPAADPITDNTLGKRIPKPKMPKGASPPPPSFSRTSLGQSRTPPSSRSNSQTSPKMVASAGAPRAPAISGAVVKSNENSFTAAKSSKLKNKIETCTIQCLPAMGMIPQLQCTSCLCMYHPECVDATTAEILARRFTCKICLEEQMAVSELEDGIALNKSAMNTVTSALLLPIQALNNGNSASPSVVDKQKKPTPPQQPPKTGPGTPKAGPKEPPPQDVIVVGNHQFIVVPKGKMAAAKTKKQNKQPLQQQQTQQISTQQSLQPIPPEEARKPTTGGSKSSASQNNRNFVAADVAAIRSDSTAVPRSSSIASGADQNWLFASNFFSNVSNGYDILQQTFQYLKVQELLRASCVCRMWNHVANHPRLWKTVRMKNSHVNDWSGLANTLRRNGTKHLDLRKMLISGNSDEMWQSFTANIANVENLERIDLCRCSSSVVGHLLKSNPNLKIINALAIKNDPVDFSNFENGHYLQELRLKSSTAVSIENDLTPLRFLNNLRHLSLTSILKLGSTSIKALGDLKNLETLELGECTEIGQNFAELLPNLAKLQRLRIEKGQENFNMFAILDGLAKLPNLKQLELINCDVKVGFDKHINKCHNIRKLLLIPTYVSQSAATNHMVLSGVAKLKDTLEMFIWTVTVELLRVTELYIDQCDTKNRDEKNSPGESIPILKPVPGVDEISMASNANPSDMPAQVEIVPLVTVNNILDRSLPKTKLKILKIPFASTWKQGMIELL